MCARQSGWRCVRFGLVFLAIWTYASPALAAEEILRNVGLVLVPREILLFSAPAGQWTSIRVDAGERILQRSADGNVAAVLTSQRLIGFSGILNVAHEIGVSEEETLESFKVEGNMVNVVTRRRAYGFSAFTGKWAIMERFQLGR